MIEEIETTRLHSRPGKTSKVVSDVFVGPRNLVLPKFSSERRASENSKLEKIYILPAFSILFSYIRCYKQNLIQENKR